MKALTESVLRQFLETAPDAMVGVDETGAIVLTNAQTGRLFGYTRDELIGRPVEMLVPTSAQDIHPVHRGVYLASPATRPVGVGSPAPARRKDGTEFPAEISLSIVDTVDGFLVSVAIRDVTERRHAFLERQHADALLSGILEAAPDAIVGVDDTGQICFANAQVARVFGYEHDELVGHSIELLVPDGKRFQHPAHRADYAKGPKPRPMGAGIQLAARRKDGTEFPAEISLSPVPTTDGTLVAAAIRDITDRLAEQAERERLRAEAERERVERQLTQSQRLESLGELAGGVAHDFNNLLAVILNYADFAREAVADAEAGRPPADWSEVRRDIEQIERAGDRAAGMTRRLLTFAHREVVRPQVLDLNQSVREVEHLLRRSIGEHVALEISLAETLSYVLADPGQIEQVLVNLAINARDAMPRGGTLTIDTCDVTVDADFRSTETELQEGAYVRLRVSDDGTGMDEATLARVFEPFFSTKPMGEGSGLGLATVYGIVMHAGGVVHVYSEVGPGTTVSVWLPATTGTTPEPERHSARALTAQGETVLVVEDEEAIRELTRRVLVRNGYDVITAADGVEAIALAEHHPERIHLLLTDVIMPGLLGREIAQRIAAIRPGIRILFMSGYAGAVLSSQGSLDPGLTLLEKPFTEVVLLEHVRDVLDAPAAE